MRKLLATCFAFAAVSGYTTDLQTVYQQALKSTPSLKADLATSNAVQASANVSGGALLPQIALSASGNIGLIGNSHYEQTRAGISLSQSLFDIGTFSTWRSAQQTANASNSTYHYQLQQFILTVAKDYLSILQATDQVGYDSSQIDFLAQTLKETKQKLHVGLNTMTDVKQAQAKYDAALAQKIIDTNKLAVAKEQLFTLTNTHYQNFAPLKSNFPFNKPKPADITLWVKRAKSYNRQLQSAQHNSAAARNTLLAAAGSNWLPSISLTANYGKIAQHTTGNASAVLGPANQTSASIGLSATWSFWQSGGGIANTIQQAETYGAALATQDETQYQIVNKTRQDYLNVIADIAKVKAYQQSVKAGQSSLNQFQAAYQVGTQTIVGVLQALTQLYQAQQNFSTAEYQYIIDWLNLQLDAGSLDHKAISYLTTWLDHSSHVTQHAVGKTTS